MNELIKTILRFTGLWRNFRIWYCCKLIACKAKGCSTSFTLWWCLLTQTFQKKSLWYVRGGFQVTERVCSGPLSLLKAGLRSWRWMSNFLDWSWPPESSNGVSYQHLLDWFCHKSHIRLQNIVMESGSQQFPVLLPLWPIQDEKPPSCQEKEGKWGTEAQDNVVFLRHIHQGQGHMVNYHVIIHHGKPDDRVYSTIFDPLK